MAEEKKENLNTIEEKKNTTGKNIPVEPDIVLDEFELFLNELLDQFKVGETGRVIIPVEVIRVENEKIRFKKSGSAEVEGSFNSPTVAQLKKSLPIAER